MHFLVIGFSSLARRRLLPALRRLGYRADVATRSRSVEAGQSGLVTGTLFGDYVSALGSTDARWVYVSTANGTHADIAREALRSGRHVIVDKPAFASIEETRELLDLARNSQLCLAEAMVFPFHPWVSEVRAAFAAAGSRPEHLSARFSFPPLSPDNFRYSAQDGGGAISDLGPYVAACGRIFFDAEPSRVELSVQEGPAAVEVGFSVLAEYPDGRTLTGRFGFTSGYANGLDLLGPDIALHVDRPFTPPPEEPCAVRGIILGKPFAASVQPCDPFQEFLSQIAASGDRDHERAAYARLVDRDSRAVHALRAAARRRGR